METREDIRGDGNMRLGLDFGVSATVIAASVPGRDTVTLEFMHISRTFPASPGRPVHTVPSFVEYQGGKPVRFGGEVLRGGGAGAPSTARWLRRSLCDRSPVQVPAGDGRMVRYEDAVSDLLLPLLAQACREYPGAGLTIAIPPEAPDGYGELLQRVARSAGIQSCSLVSEYDAALAGYGYSPAAGEPVVFLTFSETDIAVDVLARYPRTGTGAGGETGLRVLAQATGPVNCRAIDSWIGQDLLRKFRLLESDPRAVRLMPQVLYEAARLREHLPAAGELEARLTDTVSAKTFTALCTTRDLERILADHEVIPALEECISRALSAVRMRGGDPGRVRSVFLLGAGCALPAVQEAVRSRFPGSVVYADHLLDAVACGAAGYAAPARAADRITRSYALRYWDPAVKEHHYRFLVHSGTRYPSAGQVARIVISASYDGQTLLGIPLYEIGGTSGGAGTQIELVSDTGGGVRLAGPAQDAGSPGQVVHANERSPTLLVATPPARKGEPRFECTFTIDPDRNLCLSARDLVTGTLVKVNAPVYRMT